MGKLKRNPKKTTMTDDCFFNPDACAAAAEEDTMMEEEEEMGEPNDEEKQWMFEGNLAFLMLSGGAFVHALMDVTSWKWALIAEGTDADGETEDQYSVFGAEYGLIAAEEDISPLWRQATMLLDYSMLAVMGAAFVTQALSMAGIAAGVSMMVWGWGVSMGLAVVELVWAIMTWMQWWSAWSGVAEDADEDDDVDEDNWRDLADGIEGDWMKMSAATSAAALTVWAYGEVWMVAQWWALPEEERQAMWEEHEGEKDEKEMMLNRMFRF